MKAIGSIITFIVVNFLIQTGYAQHKAVFIILDGIPADVLETTKTPVLDEIANRGRYTRALIGGEKNTYSESPTISAVGYNHLLTGTWTNKHNVWDNDIKAPNYNYWNIFRIAETGKPGIHTAIFSTWLDNRTKLVGEGLASAGNIKLDYAFDGFELDTVTFPHQGREYIFQIDEHVSKEAQRYIAANGPDLSWVYLEYTDDMGHMYGDSPQLTDAVIKADAQVGRIWEAIKEREARTGEKWMIVVTTDHGRDEKTGKHHGGQSDRERTVWIVTNISDVNKRLKQTPSTVDIMPSILNYLNIEMPDSVKAEVDGVPFIGDVSISNLKAKRTNNSIQLMWDILNSEGDLEVMLATTNHFKEGGIDEYKPLGKVKVAKGSFTIPLTEKHTGYYKILVKAPYNWLNTWVVVDK